MVGKHSNNSVNKQNNRHTLIEFPTRELHIILSAPDLKKLLWVFPGGTVVKNPPANAGDTGDVGPIPVSGRSPEEMAIHCSILAWKIPWIEDLAGYWPWGHKESDTHEHALTQLYI